MKMNWKLHPQPSSLRKARGMAKVINELYGLRGKTVLDPFCGTGTILVAVHKHGATPIGTDIENWSSILRPGTDPGWFKWGIDAEESAKIHNYNFLITDPPNPNKIIGGRLPSAYRDTGITGAQLRRMLKLNPNNVMGKAKALKKTRRVIDIALSKGAIVVVNAFGPYEKYLSKFYQLKPIFETYVEVVVCRP